MSSVYSNEFPPERKIISAMAKKENRELTEQEEIRLKYLESTKIQGYLDKGVGLEQRVLRSSGQEF